MEEAIDVVLCYEWIMGDGLQAKGEVKTRSLTALTLSGSNSAVAGDSQAAVYNPTRSLYGDMKQMQRKCRIYMQTVQQF